MEKVDRNCPTGCWQWTGSTRGNYGKMTVSTNPKEPKKTKSVHRVAFEIFKGKIPDGHVVCHTCDNPLCCNPAHLFIGTQLDNVRDCMSKGRHKGGKHNAGLTHCKQGHPYNEENTYWQKGRRVCVTCKRNRRRFSYLASKEGNSHKIQSS